MRKNEQRDWPSFFSSYIWYGFGLAIVVLLILQTSCATSGGIKVPTYEEAKAQALKEAPFVMPKIEDRKKLKCDDKSAALAKDVNKGIPFTGVLVTNDKAECLIARTAERDRLRIELEAERLRARTKEIINDAAMKRIAEETKQSWWDRYGGGVLFATGAAVGMAIIIGVMYALTGGKSLNAGTQARILVQP
jgi:hypothetical protein